MVKIQTLNELFQLRDSAFNQPHPRHGLRLLYWFANASHINPQSGEFGFHRFYNWNNDDEYDNELLPSQDLPYYEVGNLNTPGAEGLPKYVRSNNGPFYGDYNKDRIIVRVNQGSVDRVYVTQHKDQRDFMQKQTYRISQGLLNQIRGMDMKRFLKIMQQSQLQSIAAYQHDQQQQENSWSWCTIL